MVYRLSITRGLARTLGGDCWAESLEGEGSTFYLLVTAEKAKQSELPLFSKDPSATPRRALVLATQSPTTAVLQANLECFGIGTRIGSIEESVNEPPPDLVVVDVEDLTVTSVTLAGLKTRYVTSKVSALHHIFIRAYSCLWLVGLPCQSNRSSEPVWRYQGPGHHNQAAQSALLVQCDQNLGSARWCHPTAQESYRKDGRSIRRSEHAPMNEAYTIQSLILPV